MLTRSFQYIDCSMKAANSSSSSCEIRGVPANGLVPGLTTLKTGPTKSSRKLVSGTLTMASSSSSKKTTSSTSSGHLYVSIATQSSTPTLSCSTAFTQRTTTIQHHKLSSSSRSSQPSTPKITPLPSQYSNKVSGLRIIDYRTRAKSLYRVTLT